MKSMVCFSRNSLGVKLLNSADLFSSRSSLHLHPGYLLCLSSYFLISSFWKSVMTLLVIYILDIFSWIIDFKLELKDFDVHDKAAAFSKKFQLWICQVTKNNFNTFRPPDLLWVKMSKQSDVKGYLEGENTWWVSVVTLTNTPLKWTRGMTKPFADICTSSFQFKDM